MYFGSFGPQLKWSAERTVPSTSRSSAVDSAFGLILSAEIVTDGGLSAGSGKGCGSSR